MTNKEVIEQLKSLKAHCESMKESGEEWEKDVQALEYAITELERTAQEVPVQEQLKEIYPTTIEFYASLQSIIDNRMVTSDEAIKLNLQINSNMYDVNDVYRGIILIYQRLLECFR